jgi:hypothetical protein
VSQFHGSADGGKTQGDKYLNLVEPFRIGGPKIWIKVGNIMQENLPISQRSKAMANMLELN